MSVSTSSLPSLVYLLGMPGCGKSSVGKVLAQEIGYGFLDLDAVLEQQENATIGQIFEQKGQDYFRQAEARALRGITAAGSQGLVVATGGGAPCFHGNTEFMVGHGLPVYLKISVETLVQRLTAVDIQARPLLQNKSVNELAEYLAFTLSQREMFYQRASVTVNTDSLTVSAVTQEVIAQVRLYSSGQK